MKILLLPTAEEYCPTDCVRKAALSSSEKQIIHDVAGVQQKMLAFHPTATAYEQADLDIPRESFVIITNTADNKVQTILCNTDSSNTEDNTMLDWVNVVTEMVWFTRNQKHWQLWKHQKSNSLGMITK